MDQKNLETILEALAEKIRELELMVTLKEHDCERLREEAKKAGEENRLLRSEIARLAEQVAYLECGDVREV